MKSMTKMAMITWLFIILFLACSPQRYINKCTVQVKDVKLKKVGILKTDLDIKIVLHNPNRFKVTVIYINYDILVEDKKIGSGEKEDKVTIKAKGKTDISFPITVNNVNFGKSLIKLQTNGFLECNIKGKIKFKTKFGPATLPFNVKKKIKR